MVRTSSLAIVVTLTGTAAAAHAAPVTLASCRDGRVEMAPTAGGRTGELRVQLPAKRGTWTARVTVARVGARTRTLVVENVAVQPAGKAPSQLFADLLLDDKKVIFRHASEGDGDPAIALDLVQCTFDGDPAIATLVAPPAEAPGCAALEPYRAKVAQVAKQ